VLLARLFDGAARSLWPASVISDEELDRARAILGVLHYAFHNAIPPRRLEEEFADAAANLRGRCADFRGRIPLAIDVLRAKPTTQRGRLLQYVEYITDLVERFRNSEDNEITRGASAPLIVWGLTTGIDPAFANLSPERVREALLSVVSKPNGKGGAGNIGGEHVAAELAVEANAFDAQRTDQFDRDVAVAAFKGRIRTERSRALNALARKASHDE
jgi:hypothetical protein